jgi:ABC-type multidrug transport system fused ATPase/permease subunit
MHKNILKSAIQKNVKWLIGTFLLFAAFVYVETLLISGIGEIIDVASLPRSAAGHTLWEYALFFLLTLPGMLLLYYLYQKIQIQGVQKISTYIRTTYGKRMLNKSISIFSLSDRATYQSILINDTKKLEETVVTPLLSLCKQIIAVIVASLFLARYNLVIVGFLLLISALPGLLPKIISKKLQAKMEDYEKSMEEYTGISNEMLIGQPVFRHFGAEEAVMKRHQDRTEKYAKTAKNAYFYMDLGMDLTVFSGYFVSISTLILAMVFAILGYLSVGDMFAIYFISSSISEPIYELSETIPALLAGKVFYRKFDEPQLQLNPECQPQAKPQLLRHEITVQDVSFIPLGSETTVLQHITTTFQVGKKYLIVGSSGSGKTSFVKVLMGFYEHDKGEVRYDNHLLQELPQDAIWNQITYVPKHPTFFAGTIRENLTLFQESIDDSQIEKMAQYLGIREKIMGFGNCTFRDGLNTILDENAADFSEGEKQRLALTRALLKDAQILILDEATSAIDYSSAREIEGSLLKTPGLTLIAISHRRIEETLPLYDEIIVMDKGSIAEKSSCH